MENIYQNTAKKLLKARKILKSLAFAWLNALKKDFAFHNKNTELLAIWTVLFMTITGLFVIGIKSKLLVILLLLILSLAIALIAVSFTTYYLYAIEYHLKKQLLPRTHSFLNKSFKLRSLLRFVKIPSLPFFTSPIKNFKHFIKPLHY